MNLRMLKLLVHIIVRLLSVILNVRAISGGLDDCRRAKCHPYLQEGQGRYRALQDVQLNLRPKENMEQILLEPISSSSKKRRWWKKSQHRPYKGKQCSANLINSWLESSFAGKVLLVLRDKKLNLNQQSPLAVMRANSVLVSVWAQPTDWGVW